MFPLGGDTRYGGLRLSVSPDAGAVAVSGFADESVSVKAILAGIPGDVGIGTIAE